MILFTFIWICVSCVSVESKTKLGDVIPLCSVNDVNVNDCLRTSTQNILPALAKGIKGWNLIGMDPFFVPLIELGQDDGPISIKWTHINTTITGYSNSTVTGASVSKKGNLYHFVFNITVDKFSMIGKFQARGRMLFFPIKNEGHQEIHSGLGYLRIKFQAETEKKNGVGHLKIEKFKLGLGFAKDIKIVIKNDSKKPTPMDLILSKFLTNNAPEIVEEMRPTFESAFAVLIKTYIQLIFSKIPIEEMFKQ